MKMSINQQAYGHLYQWGRAADGHQIRTSGTTSTLSNSDNPGHGDFILTPASPTTIFDWRSPKNDNLWQGVNGINNPCPVGFRLPTASEWDAERQSWSSNDAAGAFASPLKLTMAGDRGRSDGLPFWVGTAGYYWSGTVNDTYSQGLYFRSSEASMFGYGRRASGSSVRCIKD